MGSAYLSQVLAGWTGTVAVTVGSTTTTITPRLRESVASLWARIIAGVYVDSAVSLAFVVIAIDFANVSCASNFTLTLTGNCATRLDMASGPYGPTTSVTTDGAEMSGVVVPTGLRSSLAMAQPSQSSTGDGSYASALWPSLTTAQLMMSVSAADAWAYDVSTVGVYDIAADAGLHGRVRIDGWNRAPMGRKRNTLVELSTTAQAVVE